MAKKVKETVKNYIEVTPKKAKELIAIFEEAQKNQLEITYMSDNYAQYEIEMILLRKFVKTVKGMLKFVNRVETVNVSRKGDYSIMVKYEDISSSIGRFSIYLQDTYSNKPLMLVEYGD